MTAFPLLFWIASHPLAGSVVLAAAVAFVVGVRRALRLVRCFSDCGGFSFDLGGRVRITIAQPRIDDLCEPLSDR